MSSRKNEPVDLMANLEASLADVREEQERRVEPSRRRLRYEIQVARLDSIHWTARCYHEDGEHVWSSEQAPSIATALREIARGIEEDDR